MRYMLTQNGNYIVEDKSEIILKHKNSIITRYAFFNKNLKFMKLTEYNVWRKLSDDRKILYSDVNEENSLNFIFPPVFKYNFIDETISKSGDKIRIFYNWSVKHNHIFPVLTFFVNNIKMISIKYDVFAGKILEKTNIEFYKSIISEKRNTTFPQWVKYLMFNTTKHYKSYNKKMIESFKKS